MPLVKAKLAVPTGVMGVVPGWEVQHEYSTSEFWGGPVVPAALLLVILHEEKVPAQYVRYTMLRNTPGS